MNKSAIAGYGFGMLTALCWAISPIFISLGLQGLPSSIWGTAIGLSIAALVYLVWYFWRNTGPARVSSENNALSWQIGAGVTGGLGILARNIALDFAPVAIVISLAQTAALFTIILGPILLGAEHRERISARLVIGVLTLISGSVLIIIGRNA